MAARLHAQNGKDNSNKAAKRLQASETKQVSRQENEALHQDSVLASGNLSPADAAQLQRTIGNQALGRLSEAKAPNRQDDNGPKSDGAASLQAILRHSAAVSGHALNRPSAAIQAKLTLGPVGDQYEQEADQVAKQVVSRLAADHPVNGPAAPQSTQRQEDEEELAQMQPISTMRRQEEEEELQTKSLSVFQRQEDEEELAQMQPISTLRRQEEEEELQAKPISIAQRQEEEEELQAKPISIAQRQEEEEMAQMQPVSTLQRQEEEEEELQAKAIQRQEEEEEMVQPKSTAEGGPVTSDIESAIQGARSGGRLLADGVRAPMEQAFGADFGGVKVHTDSQSDSLNQSLQARAFTTGQDIFFRQGEYSPGSSAGQELLAHELTHVVQQTAPRPMRRSPSKAGRVQDRVQRMGKLIIQRAPEYPEVVKRFKPGDLMYGLAMARPQTPIKKKLKALDTTGGDAQQAATVLDELNNFFIGTGNLKNQGDQYGMAYGTPRPGYNPDPAVATQATAFKQWLETDPAFKDVFTSQVLKRGLPVTDRQRTWERIKQVCKAGLYYTTKVKKNHIFFFLDNLNMADVVNKLNYNKADDANFDPTVHVDPATGDSKEDITPAELRFLFRNRTNPEIIGRVSWWKGGAQASAPWVDRPALWQKYEDQRAGRDDDDPKVKDRPVQPQTTDEEIDVIRENVLNKLGGRKFAAAAKHAMALNLGYVTNKNWSRKIKGLGTLDSIRHEAKNINPQAADAARETQIAAIAARAYAASSIGSRKFYKGSLLNLVAKTAFYLTKQLPEEHIKQGAVYQAQTGVTGKSKLSVSPTALLVMGVDAGAKANIISRIVPDPANWVHADPSAVLAALPAYKESQKAGTAVPDSARTASEDISKDIVARAMLKHRHLIYSASGFDKTHYQTLIQNLHDNTDYRIKLVLVHNPGENANDADRKKQAGHIAWYFHQWQSLADEAFLYGADANVKWKIGHSGTPIEAIRNIEEGDQGGWKPTAEANFAQDPRFEQAAIEFEERLGIYAFNHARSDAITKKMADKIISYMNLRGWLSDLYDRLGVVVDDYDSEKAWKSIGTHQKVIAGAVGTEVDAIKEALQSGNVRERMTHIYNFMNSVLGRDLVSGKKQEDIEWMIRVSGMNLAKLKTRRGELGESAEIGQKEKLAEATPDNDAMKAREGTRYKTPHSVKKTSDRAASEVPGLSGREKTHMDIKQGGDTVGWNEGVKAWMANEASAWVQANRQLSLPVAAGPSGHTNTFMQTAEYLNVNKPYDVRLAIIGHLLPIRAHSLIEILDVAKAYGANYTPGQQVYTNILPLSTDELRNNVAKGKKFPHEIVAEQ